MTMRSLCGTVASAWDRLRSILHLRKIGCFLGYEEGGFTNELPPGKYTGRLLEGRTVKIEDIWRHIAGAFLIPSEIFRFATDMEEFHIYCEQIGLSKEKADIIMYEAKREAEESRTSIDVIKLARARALREAMK